MENNAIKYQSTKLIQSNYSKYYTEEERLAFKELINNAVCDALECKLSPAIHKGQYRLSYRLLEKLSLLITKNVSDKETNNSSNKKKYEYKITKSELLLLILILQMCDANNTVYDFTYIKDIAPLKDCTGAPLFSKSTFYYAYESLRRKKIIHMKELDNGKVNISVPDNHINKNERYISLQTEFLLHDSEKYLAFRSMKLASMKLYLYYLANTYTGAGNNLNNAPSISIEQIKRRMGVKQNRTVRAYIKSLESAFGTLKFLPGGGKKAFVKGTLRMSNLENKFCFAKRQTLSDTQLNSFRRYFDKTIQEIGIETDKNYKRIRDWVYLLLSERPDLSMEKLYTYLISTFYSHKKLDMLSFADAAKTISNASYA